MKNVLVIGGSSLLGRYLHFSKPEEFKLYRTYYTNPLSSMLQLDVCNLSQINYIFEKVKPEVVIHCSAVGSVDYTETHYTQTEMVNFFGVQNVAKVTQDHRALFVYISTNAVYSGDNPPYTENSSQQPVNRYGALKSRAEDLAKTPFKWLIIRPFMLYGWPYSMGRENWVTTILGKLQMEKPIKLVNDVWWMPTYAFDMAQAIWALIATFESNGSYNIAADDRMTLYEFGLKVAKVWGLDESKILPISTAELIGLAKRPVDTSYDLTKIKDLGFEISNVEEGLAHMRVSKNV